MISIKTKSDIDKMRISGKINYETHKYLESNIKPGITTKYLNDIADEFIRAKGGIPSFLNYEGYPASICISIDEEVVHGIPSTRKLKNGDLVSIDIGVIYDGMHSDSAWTYKVGTVSEDKERLLLQTKEALYKGLLEVKEGARLGNISNAIERHAKKYNLSIVQELVGHGVGYKLHEEPDIPNYGKAGVGPTLKAGMTLAIEPMLNLGTRKVFMTENDWTIITQDNKPSAHFEHTVLVTKDGYEILTKEWWSLANNKEEKIEIDGKVLDVIPGGKYKVELANGYVIEAHVSGKIRMNMIRILPGDGVTIELSPYDLTHGRITYRK